MANQLYLLKKKYLFGFFHPGESPFSNLLPHCQREKVQYVFKFRKPAKRLPVKQAHKYLSSISTQVWDKIQKNLIE